MNHHASCKPEKDIVFMRVCEQCGSRESADFEVEELQKERDALKATLADAEHYRDIARRALRIEKKSTNES